MKRNKYILLLAYLTIFFTLLVYKNVNEVKSVNITDEVVSSNIESQAVTQVAFSKDDIEFVRKKNNNNKDIKGILSIDNTTFSVPLLQTDNNDYYLNHLPNKQKSFIGSVFIDYRVNFEKSKKILIYGHNSSRYNMPFYILEKYYDKDYLENHKYLTIKSEFSERKYELLSIFIETKDFSYMNVSYTTKEYKQHLDNLYNKSMYKMDTSYDENTKILILQTCSTHKDYKKYSKKYLLLVFKEIKAI